MMRKVSSTNNTESLETCSFKSTILAGHAVDSESQVSSENSYQTACSGGAAERLSADISIDLCRSELPSSLDRPIDALCQPNSDLDLSYISAEQRNSDEMNKNIRISKISRQDSWNENHDKNNEVTGPSLTLDIGESLSTSPRSRRLTKMPNDGDSNAKILKRMSQEFMISPRNFTEKLITIIDESATDYQCNETGGINLSRMTKEFRKICKYIQDESMPEHMNSTLGITGMYGNEKMLTMLSHRAGTIDESIEESISSNDFHTPEEHPIRRETCPKTPLNIFKNKENCPQGSPGSPNSTKNFVYLENILKEQNYSPLGTKSLARTHDNVDDLSNRLRDKMMIVKKSEAQLASLDEPDETYFETFDSHRIINDPCVANADRSDDGDINEDELSMSLRIELEKKRERCFETARLIQKIEEDARRTNDDYPNTLKRFGIDIESECIKTIKSCQDYEKCWLKLQGKDNLERNVSTRRKENYRKIQTTSHDSNRYATNKKSHDREAASRISSKNSNFKNIAKNPRSEVISSLRSNNVRLDTGARNKTCKPVSTSNVRLRTPGKIVSTPRRRSPENMCAKSLVNSRSRCGEKLSTARDVETRLGNCQTIVNERTKENNEKLNTGARSQSLKSVSTTNLGRGTPKKASFTPRRRSPVNPRLMAPTLARSRSRSGEKLSSPRIIAAKENFPTNENDRVNRAKLCLPKVVVTTPIKSTLHSAITPREVKPSTPRVTSASPRSSPFLRKTSRERIPKIVDCPNHSPASQRSPAISRNRFFITPGKKGPVKTPKKNSKTFFPTLEEDLQLINRPGNLDGPRSPIVSRFNHVESPVSMYIHGTDMNLIQNVHTQRDEWLLTPTKKNKNSEERLDYNLGPATSTPTDNSQRNHHLNVPKNSNSPLDYNDENASELGHPTVFYKPATQVCTVSRSPRKFGGARVRGLLESMENVVVIRHERKRYEKNDAEVPSSDNDPDMSIHVYTPAAKTKQN